MESQLEVDCINKSYANAGNKALMRLLKKDNAQILDVGCGSGDNARLIKSLYPNVIIHGITLSEDERKECLDVIDECVVHNVENGMPESIKQNKYDTIIFSHVLEHLSHPSHIVEEYSHLLNEGGEILIAVPNVLIYTQRMKFLFGNFDYTETGTMDMTHLRFFTYKTADKYLLADIKKKNKVEKYVEGALPIWKLRKIIPAKLCAAIDNTACRMFPNLFGFQVILKLSIQK